MRQQRSPSIITLHAQPDVSYPYSFVWWYEEGLVFRERLAEDEWWAPLGPSND